MDDVSSPKHYNQGEIECIDAIESMVGDDSAVDICRANALKYIWRCRDKNNPVKDLQKAQWYIERLISKLS